MLNKENRSSGTNTKEKESERKQFDKPGEKDKNSQFKPESKTKTQSKTHGRECADMSEEDEECESSAKPGKSCH